MSIDGGAVQNPTTPADPTTVTDPTDPSTLGSNAFDSGNFTSLPTDPTMVSSDPNASQGLNDLLNGDFTP
jgi:hypothetical protein